MDTSRLRALINAAEHGSLSHAARTLDTQVSTVSRQIAELEAEVGAELLVRTGRGVRPTPAGERFIERARFLLLELDAAVADARGQAGTEVSALRVSAPLELALSLLPACVAELHAELPQLSLDLHSEARRVSLFDEDYDAALRLGSLPDSSLIGRRLGAISLVVCGAPALGESINVAGLRKLVYVGVSGLRAELEGRLRGRPIELRLDTRIRTSTFTEAAELAARSQLATVLPSYTASRYLEAGRLVVLAPQLRLPSVDLNMLLPPRHRGTRVLERFAELIRARLAAVEASLPAS